MKKENIIKNKYKQAGGIVHRAKKQIIAITALLFFSAIIGFLFPSLFQEQILEIIKELIAFLEDKSTNELIIYIFFNNIKASALGMLLGIAAGVFPIFTTILNGYIIGFASNLAVQNGGVFVLWRLLPHGIFEIPAVLLSLGIGLYLGGAFLKEQFGIKSGKKQISIALLLTLLLTPIFVAYYKLAETIPLFDSITPQLISENILTIIFLALVNLAFFGSLIYILYVFLTNKRLKRELADAIIFFIFVTIPLLIIAGIIEGLLIGLSS
ncbi:MAG: stage II sporulation protein M [Patescibacteria group bacterium]|jgi:stage II sporulation protein M